MKAIMEKKAVNKTVNLPDGRKTSRMYLHAFPVWLAAEALISAPLPHPKRMFPASQRLRWWSMGMMKMCCIRLSHR